VSVVLSKRNQFWGGIATTCLVGNKLVNFLSQIFCVCVCGSVGAGGDPIPFFSQLVPFTLFKKDLAIQDFIGTSRFLFWIGSSCF